MINYSRRLTVKTFGLGITEKKYNVCLMFFQILNNTSN